MARRIRAAALPRAVRGERSARGRACRRSAARQLQRGWKALCHLLQGRHRQGVDGRPSGERQMELRHGTARLAVHTIQRVQLNLDQAAGLRGYER